MVQGKRDRKPCSTPYMISFFCEDGFFLANLMVPLNKVRPERTRDRAGDKKVEGGLFSIYTKRAVRCMTSPFSFCAASCCCKVRCE